MPITMSLKNNGRNLELDFKQIAYFPDLKQTLLLPMDKGLTSKRNCADASVGERKRMYGFINRVDTVIWPP